jgi:hypothetical protein
LKLFFTVAAETVVLIHLAWIVFVVTGAFWLRRHPRWKLVHLIAVIYSLGIEAFRWICPLTHLEQALWRRAGREAYEEAFLIHYVEKLIYLRAPQWLLVSLAALVLVVTLVLYFRPLPARSSERKSKRARR